MATKARTYYLHTLDGRPAYFNGQQIASATPGGYVRRGQWLCSSLKEIREQREASRKWRAQQGFSDHGWTLGYVRVHVPEEPTDA